MKKITLFLILITASLLMIGCGGESTDEPETVEYLIIMKEYAFDPNEVVLHVGQEATLNFVNAGRVKHEFMIGRETIIDDEDRENGFVEEFFETAGVTPEVENGEDFGDQIWLSHDGYSIVVGPGRTAQLKFTVTEAMVGDWTAGCFWLDGIHYLSGMRADITVLP